MAPHIRQLLDSPEHREYLHGLSAPERLVELSTTAAGLVIVNADELVGQSPAMQAASLEDGMAVYLSVKPAANSARRRLLDHLLTKPARHGLVLLTAGGPGSGKSTHCRSVKDVDFVYDSIMWSFDEALEIIGSILASHRRVAFMFVARDPSHAMRANISRAMFAKRLADIIGFTKAHVYARQTFHALRAHFAQATGIGFQPIWNLPDGHTKELLSTSLPLLDLDQLTDQMNGLVDDIERGTDPAWDGPIPPASIFRDLRRGYG